MKHCLKYVILAIAALLMGCNKAPDGVIKESKMARLIVDLNKAENYIETHADEFPDDSTKMALKQSIFAKHGISQELYDHSLEWYGHNMDVYCDVCDRALRQLEDEKKSLEKKINNAPTMARTINLAHPRYANHGDTADVWTGQRTWMLTTGMKDGILRWDLEPDDEHRAGDKYMLQARVISNARNMTATLAADYYDGSTTSITRQLATNEWNSISLQTDTTGRLRRVYGYIKYDMTQATVTLVDSVALLRTHLDHNTYGLIGAQMTVGRQASSKTQKAQNDSQVLREQQDELSRGRFQPKQGVNKPSHGSHIVNSPNAAHLPKR